MSFLYRPTPVVNLGRGQFAARSMMGWSAPGGQLGGVMHGIDLDKSYKALSDRLRRVPSGNPWIQASGTMGEFIPNGLGGLGDNGDTVDPSSIDFYSGVDSSPNVPVFTPGVLAPDLGTPTFSPTAPAFGGPSASPVLSVPFSLPAPGSLQTSSASLPSTLTPPSGAGPTGTGIPATQVLNPAGLVAPPPSLGTQVGNFFSSIFGGTPKPTGLTTLPGYGGVAASPASFFSQSTIVPGMNNTMVLVMLFAGVALMGSLKK
jgi:hypothetical protein